jgi:hypothetical protein
MKITADTNVLFGPSWATTKRQRKIAQMELKKAE